MNNELLNAVIQWDVKSWSRCLYFWELHLEHKPDLLALESGGRQGDLSLWLALKGVRVVCSDLQNSAEIAEVLHKKYLVSELISYQDIDATNIPYENHFDVFVFKSVLGGVGSHDNFDNQEKAVAQMFKALKPGGKLLFAENMVASPLHRFFRKRFVNWGGRWRYVTQAEMQVFLKDFSSVEFHTTGFLASFGRTETQRKFAAFCDTYFFNFVIPRSSRYIGYGVAVK